MTEEPRGVEWPQPGHFRIRLRRGAWPVPAAIEQNEDGQWRAVVDETATGWFRDPWHCEEIIRIWTYGRRIEDWEYLDLIDLKRRAERETPEHPCLHPLKPMNPMLTPIVRRRFAHGSAMPFPRPTSKDQG